MIHEGTEVSKSLGGVKPSKKFISAADDSARLLKAENPSGCKVTHLRGKICCHAFLSFSHNARKGAE